MAFRWARAGGFEGTPARSPVLVFPEVIVELLHVLQQLGQRWDAHGSTLDVGGQRIHRVEFPALMDRLEYVLGSVPLPLFAFD